MKILLTGTMFVGKSTILNILREKGLPCVSLIPEVARELLEAQPELELDPNFQDILFAEQVKRETEAEKSNSPIVVCDRGSLDIIAHSEMFGHPIKSEWAKWSRTYDKIFHFRKDDIAFSNELYRNDTLYTDNRDWNEFRENLERHILRVYQDLSLKPEMLQGTIEDKIVFLEREIRNVTSFIECMSRGGKEL